VREGVPPLFFTSLLNTPGFPNMAPEPSVEIRSENPAEGFTIETRTRTAFATHPIRDHAEQFIIAGLRKAGALSISLVTILKVAILKEAIVGHIAFSPVTLSDGTTGWFGLGPLAVDPIH